MMCKIEPFHLRRFFFSSVVLAVVCRLALFRGAHWRYIHCHRARLLLSTFGSSVFRFFFHFHRHVTVVQRSKHYMIFWHLYARWFFVRIVYLFCSFRFFFCRRLFAHQNVFASIIVFARFFFRFISKSVFSDCHRVLSHFFRCWQIVILFFLKNQNQLNFASFSAAPLRSVGRWFFHRFRFIEHQLSHSLGRHHFQLQRNRALN